MLVLLEIVSGDFGEVVGSRMGLLAIWSTVQVESAARPAILARSGAFAWPRACSIVKHGRDRIVLELERRGEHEDLERALSCMPVVAPAGARGSAGAGRAARRTFHPGPSPRCRRCQPAPVVPAIAGRAGPPRRAARVRAARRHRWFPPNRESCPPCRSVPEVSPVPAVPVVPATPALPVVPAVPVSFPVPAARRRNRSSAGYRSCRRCTEPASAPTPQDCRREIPHYSALLSIDTHCPVVADRSMASRTR